MTDRTAATTVGWLFLAVQGLDLVARTNGRTGADQTAVHVTGDPAMARAVVDALPMSP